MDYYWARYALMYDFLNGEKYPVISATAATNNAKLLCIYYSNAQWPKTFKG